MPWRPPDKVAGFSSQYGRYDRETGYSANKVLQKGDTIYGDKTSAFVTRRYGR